MSTTRRFLVAAVLLVPLRAVFACGGGDDDDDSKVPSTNYVPEGGKAGDSGLGCEPLTVPIPTFNVPNTNQKLCTDDDIITVLDNCAFANATKKNCDAAKAQLAACASCIIGKETDPVAHPGYQYSDDTIAIASPSACMAAVAKDDEQKKCATAYGQFETCSLASCLPPCLDDTKDHFDACLTAALNTTCTVGSDVITTDVCKNHYNGATYGFCTSNKTTTGQDLTDPQYFFAVAKIICGGLEPPDAGPDAEGGIKDAGSDG